MRRNLIRIIFVLVFASLIFAIGSLGVFDPTLTQDQVGVAHAAKPAAGLTPQTLPTLSAFTPTATPFGGSDTRVVLESDYSSCNPIDTDTITARCENGEYIIQRQDTGGTQWIFYPDVYSDTVIEVDARASSNVPVRYGVLFRLDSQGKNYYIFGLTSEGHYGLFRFVQTQYETLIPYTLSNAVTKSTGANGSATNHLRIVAQGDQIVLYANDQLLESVRDANLKSGRVALFVEGPQQAGAQAAFDNLRVSRINNPLSLPGAKPTAGQPTATQTQASNNFPPIDLGASPTATRTLSAATPVQSPGPSTTSVANDATLLSLRNYADCDPIEDETIFARCENGEFVFLNKEGESSQWLYYRDIYDDAVFEVDARVISGPSDINYGLMFRLDPNGNNAYVFTVTRDGRFGLYRFARPDFVPLIAYTASNAVNTSGKNHLKVVAQGNQIAVYANNQLLGSVRDARISSGRIALYLESDEPNAQVAFDNLAVFQINQPVVVPTSNVAATTVATRVQATATRTVPAPTATSASLCQLNPGEAGLLILNNYTGETMRFTIGGGAWKTHDYDIPGDGRWYLIHMPPGKYTYTAFIPGRGSAHGEQYEYTAGVCRSIRFGPGG